MLGFHHMHSVYNRDEYVTIHWENIQPGLENQFIKFPSSAVTLFNTTYDYLSVMHYGAYFFSKNGKPTIVPKVKLLLNACFTDQKFTPYFFVQGTRIPEHHWKCHKVK